MNIEEALEKVLDELSDDSSPKPVVSFEKGIPTLKAGYFRPLSPMLKSRFEKLGGWEESTHGDWLDPAEMECFWESQIVDERLNEIVQQVKAAADHWQNDAGSLFSLHRISVFAASRYTYERIYLVWFDETEEPELWVYDVNGEARYKDLLSYLESYIKDDLSAFLNKWKLGEME
ncbi:hypothetical protein SAMN04488522_108229 [Pedobacter caeni]|uniref:SMI1 / KNR4 family (SUKH-1) n=2 Tax=Pedobacter caeni TaxID=288992 RepID=A0A1M5NRN4_9SPHI|nr:hypothetical protein SAMN04488522_108229 [Pedobacter caeni]